MTLISERPSPTEPRPWDYPAVNRKTLPSGLDLAYAHCPGRPFIVAQLVLEKGMVDEQKELAGITQMMAGHMARATENRDYVELGLALERLAAGVGAGSGWHTMSIGANGPIWTFNEAVEILLEVMNKPAFPLDEIEKDLAARRIGMAQRVKNPNALAGKALDREIFTDDSIYRHEGGGTWESIANLNRDAIIDVYKSILGTTTASLIVAGDLDQFDVETFAASLGDSWPTDRPTETPVVQPRNEPRHIVLVNRPGAAQSVIQAGHAGPPRKIDDRVPLGTFTHAFGGSSHSRLSMVLREEKGYTYGIGAGFGRLRHGGTFSVGTSVQNDATAPTVAEIVAQIERVRESGLTEKEFDQSKRSRLGSFPLSYQDVGGIAGLLSSIVEDDLPLTYLPETYEALVSHTLEEVNDVARKYLDPEHLVIVVVGDASVVGADLENCGVGPVKVIEAEEIFPPDPNATA